MISQSFWYETLDSTMDEAKRLIQSGKINDIALIVSNHQTNGRGTRGRKWSSPEGAGIYLSIVHLPKQDKFFEATSLYTLACGIACIETIKTMYDIELQIKPINDIYFNDKKLGGILVESKLHKDGISSLITGVGINLQKSLHNLDRDVVLPVSLEEIIGCNEFSVFSREKLIEAVVAKVCFWYSKIFNREHSEIKSTWESYCRDQN